MLILVTNLTERKWLEMPRSMGWMGSRVGYAEGARACPGNVNVKDRHQ